MGSGADQSRQKAEASLQCVYFLETRFLMAATPIWEALDPIDPAGSKVFRERAIQRYVTAIVRFDKILGGVR